MVMKHIIVMVIAAGILASCAGGAAPKSELAAGSTPRTNAEVWGSEWKLVEIRTAARSVEYDRNQLASDGFDDIFTLQFNDELTGKAAPNRYSGPYTRGDGQNLSIGNVVSTLAAALTEPVKCRESDYFAYLAKVSRWELNQGTLELYTQDADGNEAVLSYLSY
jgi:heat shock protein HslJ